MHTKTVVTFGGCFISILAWFLWNLIIGEMYPGGMSIYLVQRAFLDNYGRTLSWWTTGLWVLSTLIILELIIHAVRRVYWPGDWDVMQRLEKNGELDRLDEERGDVDAEEAAAVEDEIRRSIVVREVGTTDVVAGAAQEKRPSLQVEARGPSFQDRRPSMQDRRPSLHAETKRGSFHEGQMPERRRPRAFTTLEEEERYNPFKGAGEGGEGENGSSGEAPER